MRDEKFSGISCEDARNYDMVDYLSWIGIEPARIRGNNFWYHSPFRAERTPSFKVNRKLNRWFDFGEACGGNLIDFAIRYNNCTVKDFLLMLEAGRFSFRQHRNFSLPDAADDHIVILSEYMLTSHKLVSYLRGRRIPYPLAEQYCREVRYQVGRKIYYAIGFKNNSGGYELRNEYFKCSSSPKDFTSIFNGTDEVMVFEGFFDFLSYMVLMQPETQPDFLILNSLSLFERARAVMEAYSTIRLFLDNDKAGNNCSLYARSLSDKYKDERPLYRNYKDLNDFLNLKPICND